MMKRQFSDVKLRNAHWDEYKTRQFLFKVEDVFSVYISKNPTVDRVILSAESLHTIVRNLKATISLLMWFYTEEN